MMPTLYPLFVLATALLILTPGPMVALIVANSVAYGARYGLLTVLGSAAAMTLHMVLIFLGLAEALSGIGVLFEWVRWFGVAYLLYIGIQQWRAPVLDLSRTQAQPKSASWIFWRAVLVSLTNPKTLLFYGAFFPQFLDTSRPLHPQLAILCVTFVAVAIVIDCGWAFAASRARALLARHGKLRNRVSGGLLVGAGLGLALARPK